MSSNPSLRSFIENELFTRQMSAREFARFVGVSSSTITRAMAFNSTSEPTLTFIAKLARATNTDICALVDLIKPGERREIPITARDIAERISKLSPEGQGLIDALLIGIASQNVTKGRENK